MSFNSSLSFIIINKSVREIWWYIRYIAGSLLSWRPILVIPWSKLRSFIKVPSLLFKVVVKLTLSLLIIRANINLPTWIVESDFSNSIICKLFIAFDFKKSEDISRELTVGITSNNSDLQIIYLTSII